MNAVIFPAGLGLHLIDKPRWQNRRMEEWRRFLLTYRIATRAKNCTVVMDGTAKWFTISIVTTVGLRRPFTTKLRFMKHSPKNLIRRIINKRSFQIPDELEMPNTVQILGVSGDQSGLSKNTDMSVEALALLNVPIDIHSRPFNRTWLQTETITSRQLNQSVTLHHVNADRIPAQIRKTRSSIHIGFLLWELEQVPKSHLLAGEMLNEVWVPSSYVQKIYENTLDCNVVNVGKGFSLPEVDASNLVEYGLKSTHYLFLMSFDAHSSVERKNPLAAVLAFVTAYPTDKNVRLLIKSTPVDPAHWGDPNGQMQRIKEIAKGDPRIIVDQRMLPFNRLLALIKRADCVVSPHRAEGFGYISAYALWLGRPVVATDYSGTQDTCTADTSYTVSYKLIETREGETITPMENAYWADIDVEGLARTLREVKDNPADARIKALRGQVLMQTKYSPEMQAARYLERFKALGILPK